LAVDIAACIFTLLSFANIWPSAPGLGGIIVRDSIGGEQFQFRTSAPIALYSRIL